MAQILRLWNDELIELATQEELLRELVRQMNELIQKLDNKEDI